MSEFISINKKRKKELLKEINLDEDILKEATKREKEVFKPKTFTVYKSNAYSKLSNIFFERISHKLKKKFPEQYEVLKHSLKVADIKILSHSYLSIILFSSSVAFILFSLIPVFFLQGFIVFRIIQSLFIGLFAFIATAALIFLLPNLMINSRKNAIKADLPFVVVHMSAIAGSGAQPISMFQLLLKTEEYPGIKGEIRKIINYVNLFGYNLSGALRSVAQTTPSKEFKELLNGIVSTIESGGDLKLFLDAKAQDAFTNYKLERKKFTETLSTYSDVYTGVLIAAPLLFFVTLAIIQMLGGAIGGIDVKLIALVGTYAVLPVLNVAFFVFMSVVQPKK